MVAACAAVVTAIGKTVTWLLDSYKTTLEIKRMRNEAHSAGMKQDVIKAYEDRAEEIIQSAIKERVKQLVKDFGGTKERGKELENYLSWAMESLVWRIERGLRVEVRYLAPQTAAAESTTDNEEKQLYDDLANITSKLAYPVPKGDPILHLPSPEPQQLNSAKKAKTLKPRSVGKSKSKGSTGPEGA